MSAAEYNFTVDRGAAFYIAFEYKDNNNNIINLTNWSARFSFLPDGQSISTTYVTDTTDSIYSFIIEPTAGKIVLKLPATTTSLFNFDKAGYDLDLRSPNEIYTGAGDQVIKLLKGTMTIIASNVPDPAPFKEITEPYECTEC